MDKFKVEVRQEHLEKAIQNRYEGEHCSTCLLAQAIFDATGKVPKMAYSSCNIDGESYIANDEKCSTLVIDYDFRCYSSVLDMLPITFEFTKIEE